VKRETAKGVKRETAKGVKRETANVKVLYPGLMIGNRETANVKEILTFGARAFLGLEP
jgi:hypothetical protein